jgi:NADP-dependent 3-hydroxy acid dehydrogenase YdfG
MFELNTMSAIALTKAVLPSMLARRSGCVVAVGSMAVKCPAPGWGLYGGVQVESRCTSWIQMYKLNPDVQVESRCTSWIHMTHSA